jgi:PAS domain S-box-containing protein
MTGGPLRWIAHSAGIPNLGEALAEHFERASVGMMLLGVDRRIVHGNEALSAITGIAVSILPGSPLRRILPSDAPVDLEDRIFEEMETTGHWHGQLEIRTSIGDTSPMMVSITPVGSPGTVRYVGIVMELGQQKWIEAESSRRAAELAAFASLAVATGSSADPQAMLNAASREIVERLEVDACWIHRYEADRNRLALVGEASYLNPSLRLSGRMIPDAINPALLRAVQTREQVAESELLDRSIATVVHVPLLARDEVVGVISILSVEGEKLTTRNSDLLRAISYQVGTALQNVRLLDSVGQQRLELEEKNEQLELFIQELINADRLKNEFLANTSHELRTPLNSIIGFLNLVLDGLCEDGEEQKELLGHAVKSGHHLLGLINDVLDLARIEAGRMQLEVRDVEVAVVIAEVEATLAVQAKEKALRLVVEPVAPGVRASADEARLRQVLVNVVGNAIKFTREGEVVVGVEAPPGSPFVEIRVRDTGIGVAPEKRERLFRKFSQGDASTTRKYGGSGLGLVIVRELVEMMGGAVRLESPGEGQGTTVTITLCRSEGGGASAGRSDAPERGAPPGATAS